MAVSRLIPGGGANDFNLNIGGGFTSVVFDKEYSSGSYSITSGNNDTTLDIYAYNSDGSLAGYTNTKSFTATKGFNKMVILGGTTGDVLGFTYKTTYTTTDDSDEVTAGPVATSVTPSAVPKVDDTFTLTGRNFATNCTVTFSSTTGVYTSRQAKSIVRSSATSLIVTRPDTMPVGNSPYTITVENPGVSNPTGSNSHILANSITAGVAPVWVTGATLSYVTGAATSFTLSATDADAGSAITYSVASGTLPNGLTLTSTSGVVAGTPTTSNATVTFRATDQGGNFVDRAILFNGAPVWVTGTTLQKYANSIAYSVQLSATDDNTAVSYSLISGSLPPGLSLSSGGLISGTPSGSGTYSLTIRATDTYGATADRTFSMGQATITTVSYTSVGTTTFTLPAGATGYVEYLVVAGGGGGGDGNLAGGGGGAGGMIEGTYTSLTPGNYTVTVGGGGAGGSGNQAGSFGGSSIFHTATANGGGRGGGCCGNSAGSGGSGGGGGGPDSPGGGGSATIGTVPAGATGFGSNGNGYMGGGPYGSGGAGGGAGGSSGAFGGGNSANSGGPGRSNSITGSAVTYCTGGGGASNFYGGANATVYGGGGGGTGDATGGSGAQGIVVVRYLA